MFLINDCCYKGISMRLFYCVFFFYTSVLPAAEYVYPVVSLDDGKTILYIHQHSPTSIELLSFNTQTHQTEQMLWSVFNPAGLQMLPDSSGFSFIDNGRLRIKSFQKRSAKAIDFDEPIFGINSLHWIDTHSCYCSAQYNNNFALFELHDDGTLQCLRAIEGKDCMYPQKVNDQFFYIERNTTKNGLGALHYRIVSCSYQKSSFCDSITNLVADFDNTPIIFLTMLSATEGFVIEHAQHANSENPTMLFKYHHIIKKGNVWSKNLLFSFSIPTNLLLDSEERLYESILPLLPRIIDNKVYFIDCATNANHILEPYFYDLSAQTVQKINLGQQKEHVFVPISCGNILYFGGTRLFDIASFFSMLT
jgi:hypothetical protein